MLQARLQHPAAGLKPAISKISPLEAPGEGGAGESSGVLEPAGGLVLQAGEYRGSGAAPGTPALPWTSAQCHFFQPPFISLFKVLCYAWVSGMYCIFESCWQLYEVELTSPLLQKKRQKFRVTYPKSDRADYNDEAGVSSKATYQIFTHELALSCVTPHNESTTGKTLVLELKV